MKNRRDFPWSCFLRSWQFADIDQGPGTTDFSLLKAVCDP